MKYILYSLFEIEIKRVFNAKMILRYFKNNKFEVLSYDIMGSI